MHTEELSLEYSALSYTADWSRIGVNITMGLVKVFDPLFKPKVKNKLKYTLKSFLLINSAPLRTTQWLEQDNGLSSDKMFNPLFKPKVQNTLHSIKNNTAWSYLEKVLASRFTFSAKLKHIAQKLDRTEKKIRKVTKVFLISVHLAEYLIRVRFFTRKLEVRNILHGK